jgi:hypothetical protein
MFINGDASQLIFSTIQRTVEAQAVAGHGVWFAVRALRNHTGTKPQTGTAPT